MDIDKNSLYYQHISNRSFLHFIIGLYPRLIQYIKLNKARKKAIKQGANIGENTIIIKELACRANTNLTIGENSSIGSYKIDLRSPVHIGSGRSAPLRALSPLRTVHDSFPSYGSSNSILL